MAKVVPRAGSRKRSPAIGLSSLEQGKETPLLCLPSCARLGIALPRRASRSYRPEQDNGDNNHEEPQKEGRSHLLLLFVALRSFSGHSSFRRRRPPVPRGP